MTTLDPSWVPPSASMNPRVVDVSLAAHREVAQAARRHLDQAVAAALPLSGGKVRSSLLALQRELERVDRIRATASLPVLSDPHAHACFTCSPDGVLPGSGCHNCRQTGMDQTPCREEGHVPQCPHICCGGPRVASDSDGAVPDSAAVSLESYETAPLVGVDARNAPGASEPAAREVP